VRRGVAFIEFAFVAPLLILLVLGVIQYGLIAQSTTVVTNLSREGARFASLGASKPDVEIVQYVKDVAESTAVNADQLDVTITPRGSATRQQGEQVTVTVRCNMRRRLFLPGSAYLFVHFGYDPDDPDSIPYYTAHATMKILNK
jgi:Flp pilus assembly protein TadG